MLKIKRLKTYFLYTIDITIAQSPFFIEAITILIKQLFRVQINKI